MVRAETFAISQRGSGETRPGVAVFPGDHLEQAEKLARDEGWIWLTDRQVVGQRIVPVGAAAVAVGHNDFAQADALIKAIEGVITPQPQW